MLDLVGCHSLPLAGIRLTEAIVDLHPTESELGGDDLAGLRRPSERARPDRLETVVRGRQRCARVDHLAPARGR